MDGGTVPTPYWIESAFLDNDGALFVWYHHEVVGICGDLALTTPKIGAAISYDGGRTLRDLGIVLEAGEAPRCDAENGYFAGGHGDFSVVYDGPGGYFYFYFSNYSGSAAEQGVAVARLAYDARHAPSGMAEKYYRGSWSQPGRGGKVTPLLPVTVAWERADTDAFWGPSVHWNYHLGTYVMLLNRACCAPGWPQEGVYISFNSDARDPSRWTQPEQVLPRGDWYPTVLGSEPFETDSVAGRTARLFLRDYSEWELVFGAPADSR